MAGSRWRQLELDPDDELGGPDRGREEALEEVVDRDRALAALAGDHDLAAVGEGDRSELRGGVGMAEAAAERAPISDPRVADVVRGLGRER
jgi:hypothetical protein